MFSDNPLLAQLKQQMQANLPKKEGIVKATDKTFGFLEVDSKTRIFIPQNMMKLCLHGDKISAIIRSENDKENAEPETLIEAGLDRFIARVNYFKGRLNVTPDHPQMKKLSLKAKTRIGLSADKLEQGDWVVAHLIEHPLKEDNENFLVEISEKITDADDKIAPWWVTLAKNNLPNCEPNSLQHDEIWQVNDDNDLERVDLTHVPFVTIDGASTKDMDDALYAEIHDNGDIKLTIAIADPTAYITPDSAMDKVARERGFTIYLPGRNIPMLPRDLADDLCSLKQDELRLALCCEVIISADGVIAEDTIKFFAATIKSHARLVYDQVSDWLDSDRSEGDTENWSPTKSIAKVVTDLNQMAQVRRQWRQNNAVIFPDRPDYRFELSDDNDVIAIHADLRRTANNLVEEAMITANICAGTMLQKHLNMGVFNAHSGFKEDKLEEVIALVDPSLTPEQITSLEGFAQLRRQLMDNQETYLDHRIRKCQAHGEIANKPAPHYAMGLPIYATWTSPIRKYGDMINHRLLKALILNKEPVQTPDEMIGEELSLCRRFHNMAERNIGDWLYARTLINEPEKGTVYQAEIFDINRAGARVRLIENGAAAFIPCSQIVDDRERINASRELGTIEIDKEVKYRLGDIIEVKLLQVSIENRNLLATLNERIAPVSEALEEVETLKE